MNYRTDPVRHITSVGSLTLTRTLPFASAFLVKLCVSAVLHHDYGSADGYGVLLACSLSLTFVFHRLAQRINIRFVEETTEHYDREITRLATEIPTIAHMENPEFLDRIEQLRFQPQALGQNGTSVALAFWGLLQLVLVILLLGSVDKVLVLLPFVAGLSVLTVRKGQSRLQRAYEDAAPLRRQSNHFYEVATAGASADEVRTLRLGRTLIKQFDDVWGKVDALQRSVEVRATLETMAGAVLLAAAYVGAIALVVSEGIRGTRSPGDVLITVIVAGVINQQMVTILDSTNRLLIAMHAVGRFLWLVDYADAERPPAASVSLPSHLEHGINLEHVSFRYPGTEREVLHDVSIELRAGSIVALVGDNGAGKTTLVKLLSAMYAPSLGRITIDGIDLSSLDVDAWRGRLSAAFQDYARFELVLRESVGVGDLDWLDDVDRVAAALERAGAADLSGQLDGGLDTPLGPSFEHGANLSGGQWQKVSLGRAMMRTQPLLLVMDEPTANLDPVAERALFERYVDRARRAANELGTIVVFVTHRFSSVRIADEIIVLSAGRVVEVGSHDELVHSGGVYSELYELQAQHYL